MEKRKASRLFILGIAGLGLILVISLFLLMYVSCILNSRLHRRIETDITEGVAAIKVTLEESLLVYEQLLRRTSEGIPGFSLTGENRAAVETYLNEMARTVPETDSLYFATMEPRGGPGGFFASSDGWVPPPDYDAARRKWFTGAVRADGEPVFSNPYINEFNGEMFTTVSLTVPDSPGQVLGVAAADISLKILEDTLADRSRYSDTEIVLLDSTGLVVIKTGAGGNAEDSATGIERLLEKHRQQVLTSEMFIIIDDKVYLSSSVIPQTGWVIAAAGPISRTDINPVVFLSLGIFSVVWIGVLMLVLFRIFRKNR